MSAASERGVSGKVSGLDREPTAGELGIADGPSDEYRSGPSEPPADLPATLASIDDLAAVCERYGVDEIPMGIHEPGHRRWRRGEFQVDADDDGFGMGHAETWFANLSYSFPAAVFVAAIQAARSAS